LGAACQPIYPAASTVGSTDIATILKVHNIYRQRVALGLETQGSPAGPQPKASNMRELVFIFDCDHFKHLKIIGSCYDLLIAYIYINSFA
jgi:hypothetical protein